MSQKDKQTIENEDILEEMQDEIDSVENKEGEIDEKKLEEELHPNEDENNDSTKNSNDETKNLLAKTMADFENFKKRTQRDQAETMFYQKSKILKEILPALDDLERIVDNTLEENKDTPLYEGVLSLQKKLTKKLEKLGAVPFDSKGKEVDPDYHDVMSAVPGKEPGIIFEEYEKGYMLDGKVLRHAKVIVGAE